MKHVFIIFLFIVTTPGLKAQTVITPIWMKMELGAFNNNADSWGLDVDAAGNVYWAYNSNSFNQGLDITCNKFDSNGVALWSNPLFYGGIGRQQAYVIDASDTAVYIGGKECAFSLLPLCDMLLLKVNKSDGSLIWDRALNFSGNGYEELDGLEIKDDGIYCSGWAHELDSGIYQSDMGFWKLDYSGNTLWTNYFGKSGTAEHQDGHMVVDDNYIYACGLWDGNGTNTNAYNGSALLAKFNRSDGSFVDSTLFGSQSNAPLDAENALGMTSHGDHLYITGFTTPPGSFDLQLFVAKYDKSFNQLWFTAWGGSGAESARGISVVDDRVYVAGTSSSPSIMNAGNRDALILQLDTNGTVLSYQTWGDSSKNNFEDIVADRNAIYVVGTNILDSAGTEKTAFLLKIGNNLTDIENRRATTPLSFSIYPNPSAGKFEIQLISNTSSGGELVITDMEGRLVSQRAFTKKEIYFELNLLKPGLYFVTVDNGKLRTTRKILIQ